ncbi:MAG TPA: phospho-sugar mutase [Clostridiaceae bacterium]|nr:phospho-sugar mutase [Clostridiaceae bacterium]
MRNVNEIYKLWLENEYFDEETKKELISIKDNSKELEDRFYKDLEFGTGGLRGIIGAGTNRINKYTVRKVSQGLANYIHQQKNDAAQKGIVIAHDSRKKSSEFALEAALVFTANGIKTYLFDELRPTPELSFAVRFLKAFAGVVITASHNPKEYNGYKVYGQDGAQLSLECSQAVLDEINKINDFSCIKVISREEAIGKNLLNIIGKEIDDEYIKRLKQLSSDYSDMKETASTLKIVYTPLHGSGNKLVRRILQEKGFTDVLVVPEQEHPDPEFRTVKTPNPEDKAAFTHAIKLAEKEGADIIIATDPDCDRIGVMVRDRRNQYIMLTGNQTGCLLMEYVLSSLKKNEKLPPNGFVAKTVVTTEMARAIAEFYNVKIVEVLTGFKFIGEKIKEMDEFGHEKYLFGFEESFGYLAGTFVRDKDGVVSSMLIADMAALYKARGMTLLEGLEELYRKYGYYLEEVKSYTLKGKEGIERIEACMNELRELKPSGFNSFKVKAIRDYLLKKRIDLDSGNEESLMLPSSNVLYYELEESCWFCIRPSGTEPKIKVYFGVSSSELNSSKEKLEELKNSVIYVVGKLLGV